MTRRQRETSAPINLRAWQLGLAAAGLVALGASWILASNAEQFYRGWLIGYMPSWEATVGCLGVLMLHHLMGGNWGRAVRPGLEAGASLFPLVALAFVPIALNVDAIFPWAGEESASDPLLVKKASYLNEDAFWLRAVVYFGIWMIGSLMLIPRAGSDGQDRRQQLMPRRAAVVLVLLILSASFAAIDWGMSLEPHWFSSMYGAIYLAGGAVVAIALMILLVAGLRMDRPVRNISRKRIRGDLGSLLLAMIMVWAYFAFSQFLLIWSANLPEEIVWYLSRLRQGWWYVAVLIIALHFVVPYAMLLSQDVRFHPRALTIVATMILVGHAMHLLWTLAPAFYPSLADVPWTVYFTLLGITCLWSASWLAMLGRRTRA